MKHSSSKPHQTIQARRRGVIAVAACMTLGMAASTSWADTGAPLVPGSQEDFEGGGLGYTLGGSFGAGGTTDYWQVIPNNGSRVNPATIDTGGVFANASPLGGSVLAGDDTNAGGTSPVSVTFNPVTVTGLTNLSANVLLAASNPTEGASNRGFETSDELRILVSYDSGAFQTLAVYRPDSSFNGGTNSFLSLDTNNDGFGDAGSGSAPTAIQQGFKNFSLALGSAGTVQIRIEAKGEATGEYIAIDNFRICGDTPVTDPPALVNIEAAALNYTEGAGVSQVTNAITVIDSDSSDITGAMVTISSNAQPEDQLNATDVGSVTVAGNGTDTLTLSGTGTKAEYQQVLRSVTYTNINVVNPSTLQRSVSFQVTDDQANNSSFSMRNINVLNTVQTFSIPHTESFDDGLGTGDRYEVIGGFDTGTDDFFARLPDTDGVARFQPDITAIVGAGFFGGEDIDGNGLTDGGSVLVTLNALGVGNLSVDVLLAAVSTNAFESTDGLWLEYQFDGGAWQELLSFRPASGDLAEDTNGDDVGDGESLSAALSLYSVPIPDSGSVLKVRVRAKSGTTSEEIAFDELTVNGIVVGPSPILADINPGPLSYTEGDGVVQVSASATLTDADDTDLEGATVTISSNYVGSEDVLGFTASGGITGSFAPATGVLTLSGTASLSAYETVLKSVSYQNNNVGSPSQATRTLTFLVTDGESNSNAQNTLISVLDLVPAQSMPFCESFETDGLGTRYAANSFNFGSDDHFARFGIPHEGIAGGNADGVFAFLGEDTDADGSAVHAIEFTVDTAGYTDLNLDLKLAAAANQFELSDTILIETSTDGASFVRQTSFNPSGTNTSLSEDTNNDGTGEGTALGANFSDFNFPLADADEIRVRVTMNTSGTSEEVAVDNICITGTDVEPPTVALADPANGSSLTAVALNAQGYIDVTFDDNDGINQATITDAGGEFSLSGAAAAGVIVNGAASLVSGTTYRYTFSGSFNLGAVGVNYIAASFSDLEANDNEASVEGFSVLNSPPTLATDTITRYPTQTVKTTVAFLLSNDSDPDMNGPLTLIGVTYTGGNGGSVSLADGLVFYTPAPDYGGDDSFTYTAEDILGASSTGTVNVTIIDDNGPSLNIVGMETLGDGSAKTTFAGIPGRTYQIQKSPDMINWTNAVSIIADAQGRIVFIDGPPAPPAQFYRTAIPTSD